jgi:CRP/FNR family cyclic AMP-dependent transcriptional regulator
MSLNSDNDNILDSSSEFQENLATLRQIAFFSKLPMEKLKLFAYLCDRVSYKEGDFLFQQGDDDGQAFYFIKGKAQLLYEHTGTSVAVRHYETASFIGGIAILGKNRRIYSLQAVEPTTCLVLEREKFVRIIEQFPDLLLPAIQGNLENIHAWEKHFLTMHSVDCKQCCKFLGVSVL